MSREKRIQATKEILVRRLSTKSTEADDSAREIVDALFPPRKTKPLDEPTLENCIEHIVHDYANLVSTGELKRQQGDRMAPPIDTHVGEAFLLNCRKMYDFFVKPERGRGEDDLGVEMYLPAGSIPAFNLDSWKRWHKTMNKQLFHVTATRNTPYPGHHYDMLILDEFHAAWKLMLSRLPQTFRKKFEYQIAERLKAKHYSGLKNRME